MSNVSWDLCNLKPHLTYMTRVAANCIRAGIETTLELREPQLQKKYGDLSKAPEFWQKLLEEARSTWKWSDSTNRDEWYKPGADYDALWGDGGAWTLSGTLLAAVIYELDEPPITCREQAEAYFRSQDYRHEADACAWFGENLPERLSAIDASTPSFSDLGGREVDATCPQCGSILFCEPGDEYRVKLSVKSLKSLQAMKSEPRPRRGGDELRCARCEWSGPLWGTVPEPRTTLHK
jgi:hypothetical protein